jgi:hypothetical protein
LNLDAVSYDRGRANNHVLTNAAFPSNARSFQNVRNMPHARSVADFNAIIDKSRFMGEVGPG